MKNQINRFDILIACYSLVLVIGGAIGFLIAGSFSSLLMSTGFAILLTSSLFLHRFYPQAGYGAVFTLLSILCIFFAYRALAVKFMPAGPLCLLTLGILILACNWQKKLA